MFGNLFGGRKRDLDLAADLMRAAAGGAQRQAFLRAASSLGITVAAIGPEAVATAASTLARRLATSCAVNLTSDLEGAFVAGLFSVAGANCFSYHCKLPFEQCATLSLLKLNTNGIDEFASFHSDVIGVFNEMTRSGNKTIRSIGGMIATWEASPSADGLLALERLFQLCLETTKHPAKQS